MGALSYLKALTLPHLQAGKHSRPLVVGSGNALHVGRILFRDTDAVCVEESAFTSSIEKGYYDAVYIISASGSKHAKAIAEESVTSGIPTYLVTNTNDSGAGAIVGRENSFIYPHVREPYTYNTSTYLSMLFGAHSVSPEKIQTYIETVVEPLITDMSAYTAFLMTVPSEFGEVRGMFETKFDELFGPKILGRAYTTEEMKHAKTVITSPTQCFICLGNEIPYGNPGMRITIPLTDELTHAELIAIGYYIIGKIQKAHHPFFKENIEAYTKATSEMFGQTIPVIVE